MRIKLFRIRLAIIFLSVFVTSSIFISCDASSSSAKGSSTPQASAQPTGPTPLSVYEEYTSNKSAAEARYKGKPLTLTGVVEVIGKDDSGLPYLTLQVTDDKYDFRKIQFVFPADQAAKIAALTLQSQQTVTGVVQELEKNGYLRLTDSHF